MARERQLPEGKLIYRHCVAIFSGEEASLQKLTRIEALVRSHEASIAMLTKDFTIRNIARVAQGLLEDHVFECEACARAYFPNLLSKAQISEPATSEDEAIEVTTNTVPKTIVSTLDNYQPGAKRDSAPSPPNRHITRYQKKNENRSLEGPRDDSLDVTWQVTSLHFKNCHHSSDTISIQPSKFKVGYAAFPSKSDTVYLPFKTQHQVVAAVQRLLEECCLEWGNAYVPELMEARDWNEVKKIELTEWTKSVLAQAKILPASAIKRPSQQDIMTNLLSVSRIRHAAVHRHRLTATELSIMLSAAVDFAKALESHSRAQKIVDLRAGVETSIVNITEHRSCSSPNSQSG